MGTRISVAALFSGGIAAATLAAVLRRKGWASLEREHPTDLWVACFMLLAWGGSALVALALRSGVATCYRTPTNSRGASFPPYSLSIFLIAVGAAASYIGVYLETVVAIQNESALVEGVYGSLCTSGGMVCPNYHVVFNAPSPSLTARAALPLTVLIDTGVRFVRLCQARNSVVFEQ